MTKVARRKFLKGMGVAGLGAASASVAAPAIAQSMPEIKWRQTTSWPKSLDTLYGGAEQIAARVAALTDNKFQIQTFAGGEIVPGLQVLDAVQNGTVECGHTAMYYYFGKDDTFVFASALPFGMSSRMQNAWLLHGGGLGLLNDFLKGYNSYMLPGGNTNAHVMAAGASFWIHSFGNGPNAFNSRRSLLATRSNSRIIPMAFCGSVPWRL